jgi:predicted ATPase/DNA-binding SARP family transcriptional activator
LGPLEVRAGESPLPLTAAKQKAILALLLLHRDEVVSVDLLKEALWEDSPPTTAATALQGYVSQLRRMLDSGVEGGAALLVTSAPGYSLTATSEQVDFSRFEQLTASGREALAAGEGDRAAALLAEALALWRGPPLADFSYEGWAQAPIGRLEELRLSALEDRIEADLACGRHGELVGELESLIAEHPLRERLRGQLMLALYRGGRQADALEAYQAARRTLLEELGIDPGPELQDLNRRILNQDDSLAAPRRAAISSRIELPAPATSLIGRRDELAALKDLLGREDIRLVTLTGPGGTGKTRLALEAATESLDAYTDGVFWVSLAPLSDSELVVPTIGQVLGAENEVTTDIGEKQLLLVLDNLEHLVDCAPQLSALLAGSPRLTMLVTSREPLHVSGEHEYPVPPLPQGDAVALFIERARQHKPNFEPDEAVTRITRRLDGLPLALELAAARIKLLDPEQMLERLGESLDLLTGGARDAPQRQQTLRATIGWSFELLADLEKRLLVRLAVFPGSFSIEAAEAVCEADLDSLAALVDKSLLSDAEPGRFAMLETVREYAAERFVSPDAETVSDRHAEYFGALMLELAPCARRLDPDVAAQLETDHHNMRSAIEWMLDTDPSRAAEILNDLSGYLIYTGYAKEGLVLVERLVAEIDRLDERDSATTLAAASEYLRFLGQSRRAVDLRKQAVPMLRRLDDAKRLSSALKDLAQELAAQGELDEARSYAQEAQAVARATNDELLISRAASAAALIDFWAGDYRKARELWESHIPLNLELGQLGDLAGDYLMVGECLRREGNVDAALDSLLRGLDLIVRTGNRYALQETLQELAAVALERKNASAASRLLGASERVREEVGVQVWDPTDYASTCARARDALGDDALAVEWNAGRQLSDEEATALAASID